MQPLLIESAIRGGASITAELANSYNRDVLHCSEGSPIHILEGCHLLIRQNKAILVESVQDIAQALNWDLEEERESNRAAKAS